MKNSRNLPPETPDTPEQFMRGFRYACFQNEERGARFLFDGIREFKKRGEFTVSLLEKIIAQIFSAELRGDGSQMPLIQTRTFMAELLQIVAESAPSASHEKPSGKVILLPIQAQVAQDVELVIPRPDDTVGLPGNLDPRETDSTEDD